MEEWKFEVVADESLESMRGRTVTDVKYERSEFGETEVVTISFSDGHVVSIGSWEPGGYMSGVSIVVEEG